MKKYLVVIMLACFVLTLAGPSILRGEDYKIHKPDAVKSKVSATSYKIHKAENKSPKHNRTFVFDFKFNLGLPWIPGLLPYTPAGDDSGSDNRLESSTNPYVDNNITDRDPTSGDDDGWVEDFR